MSLNIRNGLELASAIESYTGSVVGKGREEAQKQYNEYCSEYNRLGLAGQNSEEARTVRVALASLGKAIEEGGRSSLSSVSLKGKCQNLSLDRLDMGLGISVLGAAGLSYTLSGSAACASYALCATGMPFVMPVAVAGLSILAAKKIHDTFFAEPPKIKNEVNADMRRGQGQELDDQEVSPETVTMNQQQQRVDIQQSVPVFAEPPKIKNEVSADMRRGQGQELHDQEASPETVTMNQQQRHVNIQQSTPVSENAKTEHGKELRDARLQMASQRDNDLFKYKSPTSFTIKGQPAGLVVSFDDHAGRKASRFVLECLQDYLVRNLEKYGTTQEGICKALKSTLVELDKAYQGASLTVTFTYDRKSWTANTGDSDNTLGHVSGLLKANKKREVLVLTMPSMQRTCPSRSQDKPLISEFMIKGRPSALFVSFDDHAGRKASRFVRERSQDYLVRNLEKYGTTQEGIGKALKSTLVELGKAYQGASLTATFIYGGKAWIVNTGDSGNTLDHVSGLLKMNKEKEVLLLTTQLA